MSLDFTFQSHLVMLLRFIGIKNNDVNYLKKIFIVLETLVCSTVKL